MTKRVNFDSLIQKIDAVNSPIQTNKYLLELNLDICFQKRTMACPKFIYEVHI